MNQESLTMTYFEALEGPFFTQYGSYAMEHPIPQNITSFEFHLVGDMTLKQFGYLAAGFSVAYLAFLVVLPLSSAIALPIIAISTLTGAAFAFIPILDRPLDHWVLAFLKAVHSPTQASWKALGQKNQTELQSPLIKNRLQLFLSQTVNRSTVSAEKLTPHPNVLTPTAPKMPLPSTEELTHLIETAKEAQLLKVRIAEAERQIAQLQTALSVKNSPLGPQPIVAGQQLEQATSNLQTLLKQSESLHVETKKMSPASPPSPSQRISAVPPHPITKTPISLTSTPNVINGVLFDPSGNYLEGVIVIIHNKDGVPVRALKTNKLGQFTGATPLATATYTISFEKEGFEFDEVQVTLNNEVMTPIEIKAKEGESSV